MSAATNVRVVLEASEIARAISRIAHEIDERTKSASDVVILGIPTRGPGDRDSRGTGMCLARVGSAVADLVTATGADWITRSRGSGT